MAAYTMTSKPPTPSSDPLELRTLTYGGDPPEVFTYGLYQDLLALRCFTNAKSLTLDLEPYPPWHELPLYQPGYDEDLE